LKSVDALGSVDGNCDTSNHSVSDRVCKPNATVVGFMGGHGDYPSYFSNYTALNYSETLRLEYNESLLSYKQVMDAYWKFSPDPTYPEGDPAYMLRIFVNSPQQRQIAEDSIHQKQLQLNTTIYAEVLNASDFVFWKAGEVHQQYDYKAGLTCGSTSINSRRV